MTIVLHVEQMGRRSDYQPSELPLAISLSQRGEVVFGEAENAVPAAWLGEHFGQIFVQPEAGAVAERLNGAVLKSSAWLTSGDEILIGGNPITVADDAGVIVLTAPGRTGPPVLTPPDAPAERARDGDLRSVGARLPHFSPPASEPRLLPGRKRHRGARNLLIGVFALLALGVTFVLVAASVRVAVTPEPDRMSLTGFPPPIPMGERYLVLPGDYVVTAEKAGYRPTVQRFSPPRREPCP